MIAFCIKRNYGFVVIFKRFVFPFQASVSLFHNFDWNLSPTRSPTPKADRSFYKRTRHLIQTSISVVLMVNMNSRYIVMFTYSLTLYLHNVLGFFSQWHQCSYLKGYHLYHIFPKLQAIHTKWITIESN